MDGIILINKEKGYTSNDVVQIVKHTLNEKTGHIGTLDPNATGVLPILIGKGTKISKYLINHDKIYEAVIRLGIKTDTADGEGKIIEEEKINKELLNENSIKQILNSFIGKAEQIPPMYSAIKVGGKKMYEYARSGKKIELTPRTIEIYDIKLLNYLNESGEISFLVHCSKGTYIRTLCEDIARRLKNIGYMKELKRVQVGEFNINDSIEISKLKFREIDINSLKERIISIEKNLNRFEEIKINEYEMSKFLNGVKLKKELQDGTYRIYDFQNKFIGTGIIKNKQLKRDVII